MKTLIRGITSLWMAAVILIVPSVPAVAQSDMHRPIPELLAVGDVAKSCQWRVTLAPSPSLASLLQFVEAANQYSGNGKKNFVLVGMDYIKRSEFRVITFSSCDQSGPKLKFIADFWHIPYEKDCVEGCAQKGIYREKSVTFALPVKENVFQSQVKMFLWYRPRTSLQECVIKIELPSGMRHVFTSTPQYRALIRAQAVYKYPIMDLSQLNDNVFLLFSRQCKQKTELYAALLESVKRQGADAAWLHSVDFQPNIKDYVFSQTGE